MHNDPDSGLESENDENEIELREEDSKNDFDNTLNGDDNYKYTLSKNASITTAQN